MAQKIPALFNTRASVLARLKEKDDEIAAIRGRHDAAVQVIAQMLGEIGTIYVSVDKWLKDNGYVQQPAPAPDSETKPDADPEPVAAAAVDVL